MPLDDDHDHLGGPQWLQVVGFVLVLVVLGALVVFVQSRSKVEPTVGPAMRVDPPSARATPTTPRGTSTPTAPAPQSIDPTAVPTIPDCLVLGQFSVLTFNIHGGRTDHGVDLPAVAAEIRAADADIILLQEVDQDLARTGYRDEPGVLAAALGMNAYYSAPSRSNAILTALPVTRWRSTPLPLWQGREERRLVQATVLVGGQPVQVFTTHLDQSYDALRIEQIQAAQKLMAPYAGDPVILGGDLNSPPLGSVLTRLRQTLSDTWLEVGQGDGKTVPARDPRVRIDYLLHNDWLTARTAQVLPSSASDHRAVRAVYDLWRKPNCVA